MSLSRFGIDPGTFEPIYISTNDLDGNPNSFYFDFSDCNPVCRPIHLSNRTISLKWIMASPVMVTEWLTYQPIVWMVDPDADIIYGYGKNGNWS